MHQSRGRKIFQDRSADDAESRFRTRLRSLYFGESPRARRFRYGLIAFDGLTMAIFILASAARDQWWLIPLDLVLAVVLSVELAARLYVEENRREQLLTFATLADVVVIGSLLLPAFVDNLGFLRVVRALRLLRSYHLLRDLRAASPRFRLYEDVVQRTVNLGVFIFVVTSVVYVTQNDINPGIPSLHRCPVFHHHHPNHHRVRRYHPDRTGWTGLGSYHYGGWG